MSETRSELEFHLPARLDVAIARGPTGNELVAGQAVLAMQLDNARMRRFLAILFVLLMPMQSSLAAVVSVAGMPDVGCDRGLAVVMHSHTDATAGMTHSMAGCIASGAHGGLHGHSCPHFGGFALAVATLALPADAAASSVANIEHAGFDSIVLDVPLPPPTPGA